MLREISKIFELYNEINNCLIFLDRIKLGPGYSDPLQSYNI
jgi:hypothetical protein